MNTSPKVATPLPGRKESEIPTLEIRLDEPGKHDIKLDALVGHMAEELQAIFQQQMYQAMVKTLHQVLQQESQKLSQKILDKLQQQLPEIIETGCKTQRGGHRPG